MSAADVLSPVRGSSFITVNTVSLKSPAFSFSFVFWVWLKESDYIRKTEQPQQAAPGEEETEA